MSNNDTRTLTYEEVDTLVDNYKEALGKDLPEATGYLSEIISAFNGYILKWVSILGGSNPNLLDGESVAFMCMFGANNVYSAIDVLRYCYSGYNHDELYSEVVIRFIEVIVRFTKVMYVGFSYYLSRVFRFEMFRMVRNRYRDATASSNTIDIQDPDFLYKGEMIDKAQYISLTPDVCEVLSTDNKIPCLDGRDKGILLMYVRGGYNEISETLGITRRSAVVRVSKIRRKLKVWLEEQSISD